MLNQVGTVTWSHGATDDEVGGRCGPIACMEQLDVTKSVRCHVERRAPIIAPHDRMITGGGVSNSRTMRAGFGKLLRRRDSDHLNDRPKRNTRSGESRFQGAREYKDCGVASGVRRGHA